MVSKFSVPRRPKTRGRLADYGAPAPGPAPVAVEDLVTFRKKFGPVKPDVERQVQVGLEAVLARLVEEGPSAKAAGVLALIEGLIADIEQILGDQLDEVLQDPSFLELEGQWRGLIYFYEQTAGGDFEITALPATREERRADVALGDRGYLAQTLGDQEYGMDGGKPYTYVVVADQFCHHQQDVDELDGWGNAGQTYHFFTLADAAPQLLGLPTWADLDKDRDLEKLTEQFDGVAYARWQTFIKDPQSNAAMFVGLVGPRALARPLYAKGSNPAAKAGFLTQTVTDDGGLCWMPAAFLTAARFGIALRDTGSALSVCGKRNGGVIGGLPMAVFPVDPAKTPRLPVETALLDRLEFFLSEKVRLISICGQKNSTGATQFSVNSLQVPAVTQDLDVSAGSQLRGSLAVLATCNRIAHHIRLLSRALIGSPLGDQEVKREVSNLLADLSLDNHDTASPEQRVRRPLRGFDVDVVGVDGQPGVFGVKTALTFPGLVKALSVSFHVRATPQKAAP